MICLTLKGCSLYWFCFECVHIWMDVMCGLPWHLDKKSLWPVHHISTVFTFRIWYGTVLLWAYELQVMVLWICLIPWVFQTKRVNQHGLWWKLLNVLFHWKWYSLLNGFTSVSNRNEWNRMSSPECVIHYMFNLMIEKSSN